MSTESDKQSGTGESAPVAGELLARARRARGISIQEIAKDLHLDEPKVHALEQNEFDALGAPVFAKGYLRKYAELVGVSEDDVIADYYRLNRSAVTPPLVTRRPRPIREFSAGPWVAGLLVVLVVALAAFWWFSSGADWLAERRGARVDAPAATGDAELPEGGTEPMPEEAAETMTPDPASASTMGSTTGSTTAPADADAGATDAGEAEEEVVAQSQAPAQAPGTIEEGHLQLRLAFSGDCWTEVTDAGGRRLYFGLGSSGDEVTVAGEPPLNILLGHSENVAVFVDGTAYPIPASARRGETARLTLTAR